MASAHVLALQVFPVPWEGNIYVETVHLMRLVQLVFRAFILKNKKAHRKLRDSHAHFGAIVWAGRTSKLTTVTAPWLPLERVFILSRGLAKIFTRGWYFKMKFVIFLKWNLPACSVRLCVHVKLHVHVSLSKVSKKCILSVHIPWSRARITVWKLNVSVCVWAFCVECMCMCCACACVCVDCTPGVNTHVWSVFVQCLYIQNTC